MEKIKNVILCLDDPYICNKIIPSIDKNKKITDFFVPRSQSTIKNIKFILIYLFNVLLYNSIKFLIKVDHSYFFFSYFTFSVKSTSRLF